MADDYALHRDFIRPAQASTHPRDVAIVLAMFLAAFFGFPVLMYLLLPAGIVAAFYAGVTPLATMAQFALFGVSAWVFVQALRRVHGRGFFSLIGPYQTAWRDLRSVAMAVGTVLLLIQIILPLASWGLPEQARSMPIWLALVPFAALAILIQVTTEEIVFRGYLQQQLACLSFSRWVWMVVPSALFGLWHFWNGNSAAEGVVYVVWATLLGLACADLTARTGTLGAAIGLHFAVNFVAVMFLATDNWPMSGLALMLYPYQDPDIISAEIADVMGLWMFYSIAIYGLTVLIIWLTARISLKR